MIGFTTIRTGERVAVWSGNGDVRYVDGPRRLLLWRESVKPLQLHSARPDQYLVVRYTNGRVEHVAGPAAVWLDPVVHASIETRQAMSVSAHEAVVVYRNQAGSVDRRVVEGPALFVPQPNEWLHTFHWHGADPKSPRRKVAMRSLGVDLTPYLIAQYRHPDRVIRIDGDSAGRIQLHESN